MSYYQEIKTQKERYQLEMSKEHDQSARQKLATIINGLFEIMEKLK